MSAPPTLRSQHKRFCINVDKCGKWHYQYSDSPPSECELCRQTIFDQQLENCFSEDLDKILNIDTLVEDYSKLLGRTISYTVMVNTVERFINKKREEQLKKKKK